MISAPTWHKAGVWNWLEIGDRMCGYIFGSTKSDWVVELELRIDVTAGIGFKNSEGSMRGLGVIV